MNLYEDSTESDIYGLWTDTLVSQTQGLRVHKLTIRANNSFKYSFEGYGLYVNQSLNEKSFSHENIGNFVLSTRNIYFVSNQQEYWDFISQETPNSIIEDKEIFESCTYTVANDTLTLQFKESGIVLLKENTLILTRQ